jgi:hypothetical protein
MQRCFDGRIRPVDDGQAGGSIQFFNWPTLTGAKLVVLAVANTMDLL